MFIFILVVLKIEVLNWKVATILRMINSAEEFKRLRTSDDLKEQRISALESADIEVWYEVINKFPDLKCWVIHNITIQIEILEYLVNDSDERVRSEIARKRKINEKIFNILKNDSSISVRSALIWNTKLSIEKKKEIKVDDSEWLSDELNDKIKNSS